MSHKAKCGDTLYEARTFYPTYDEFKDLSTYINSLEAQGVHKTGICKIVAPKEWIPRRQGYHLEDINFKIQRPLQQTLKPEAGQSDVLRFSSKLLPPITVTEYARLTQIPQYHPPIYTSYKQIEDEYWKTTQGANFLDPIYGADVNESLIDEDNEVWNVSKLDSILNEGVTGNDIIPGINNSYLYFGMWGATFSWHVEDLDLYATNYLHYGAPKTWYCIPPEHGYKMELLAKVLFPDWHKICKNFIRHKICAINPSILRKYGIPVLKVVQEERNFIVVFPHAYHSGFNHGFNIAEAANFAMPRWVEYGKRYRACCCSHNISAVDGQRLSLDPYIIKYQPDRYKKWKAGKDFGPHPEDPQIIKDLYTDLHTKIDLENLDPEEKKLLKDLAISLDHPCIDPPERCQEYKEEEEVRMEWSPSYAEEEFDVKRCDIQVNLIKLDADDFEEISRNEARIQEEDDGKENKQPKKKKNGKLVKAKKIVQTKKYGFKGEHADIMARTKMRKCKKRHRLLPCRKCDGCQAVNCETCIYCRDNPKYGGRGVMKQKCVKRICSNPTPSMCDDCVWNIPAAS